VNAWLTYRTTGNSNAFFYHELASPLSGHAIYLSILVTIAILFLVESFFSTPALPNRSIAICLVVFLLMFMMLLSSKLVLIFLFAYLFLMLTRLFHFNHFKRMTVVGSFSILILLIVLMLGTNNPVSRRFYDVIDGRLSMAWQNNFTPGDYFNGLQFRLLQWKLVPEILAERNRWMRGVGTGDAQDALNDKYLSRHMYAGDPDRGKKGYLAYNTHNQFLQTLLQTGIFGLVVLLLLISCLARIAWDAIDKLPKAYTCLLIVWLFTEAPLETQYGIILISFFPLLLSPESPLSRVKANLLKRSSD
jgi:O-antigen ligase